MQLTLNSGQKPDVSLSELLSILRDVDAQRKERLGVSVRFHFEMVVISMSMLQLSWWLNLGVRLSTLT